MCNQKVKMKVLVYQDDYVMDHDEHKLVYDNIVEVDTSLTARDIFNQLNLSASMNLNLYLIDKNSDVTEYQRIFSLPFYFDNGVLKSHFDPLNVKICDLKEYGFDFDRLEFLIDNIGGLGAAGGEWEFVKLFYHAVNAFLLQNPFAFELLVLFFPKVKKMVKKGLETIENNIGDYAIFRKGLTFQKEYTIDSFTKALQLEDIRKVNSKKRYFQMVNAFLIVYGYKYDYEKEKWIK